MDPAKGRRSQLPLALASFVSNVESVIRNRAFKTFTSALPRPLTRDHRNVQREDERMTHSEVEGQTLKSSKVGDRALSLVSTSLVWDDVLPWVPGFNREEIDTLLPRFKGAGVDVVSLSLVGHGASLEGTIQVLAEVRREIEERSDWLVLATSVKAVRRAREDNRLAVNFNFQETLPFETSLDLIQLYYDLGVRQALLAYNQRNLVGDGCAERTDAGLSRFGVEVVRTMNWVGMLVDGSHSGHRTTLDAMEVSERPFVFSHSNPYAVYPHYRNIKDDQIKALPRRPEA